jgi:hypothetical protein
MKYQKIETKDFSKEELAALLTLLRNTGYNKVESSYHERSKDKTLLLIENVNNVKLYGYGKSTVDYHQYLEYGPVFQLQVTDLLPVPSKPAPVIPKTSINFHYIPLEDITDVDMMELKELFEKYQYINFTCLLPIEHVKYLWVNENTKKWGFSQERYLGNDQRLYIDTLDQVYSMSRSAIDREDISPIMKEMWQIFWPTAN